MDSLKIATTGSTRWEDRKKIKDTLFILKKKFGDELEIISGGTDGADMMIKKCCMELEMIYKEIPPAHNQWSHYCIEPPYMYNKPFKNIGIFTRNFKLEKECACLIIFKLPEDNSNYLDDLIYRFQKKNKKIVLIN